VRPPPLFCTRNLILLPPKFSWRTPHFVLKAFLCPAVLWISRTIKSHRSPARSSTLQIARKSMLSPTNLPRIELATCALCALSLADASAIGAERGPRDAKTLVLPRGPQLLHGPQLPCIFLASYIDMHMLSHRNLDLSDNKITSLAGATFAGTIG
jgi:hypothetical protein